MRKIFKMLLLILCFCFVGVVDGAAQVTTGKGAPDFTLKDTKGADRSLSELKGKVVVLEWLNHDCPFVKKHYDSGNMQSLQKKFTDQNVVWLSIVSSAPGKQGYYEPDELDVFTESKKAYPTAVLLDPTGEVGHLYGAKTTPHMYIVDKEGVLVYQGAIDSIAGFDPIEIESAENYVDSVLVKLLKGEKLEPLTTKSYGCSVKY